MSRDGLACFKAYDIRGRVPDELNPELAYKIGCAFAEVITPKGVVVGHDIRLSGPEITDALTRGLTDMGVSVTYIGQCGTEEIYHATAHLGLDGGVMVTASHNPKDYNGMKMVRDGAKPISGDSGLKEIEAAVIRGNFKKADVAGAMTQTSTRDAYVKQILATVDPKTLGPLKIVVNAGNGSAGAAIDALETHLPFELIKVNHEPDGHFPNGVPNPLIEANRAHTADVVKKEKAQLGVAWDGDFDRCFFFDETGDFVDGYYIVGLLAQQLLATHPGEKIIHDPRLTWNTLELVEKAKGTAVVCKTGHAFIKERMRAENAVYGGEMSAHHYFRDFYFCDSGMLPWLFVAKAVTEHGSLSSLIKNCKARFPVSGEINRRIANPKAAIEAIHAEYGPRGKVNEIDGLSVDFDDWRFSLRMSNTEPLIRLNVEARGDVSLLETKTKELLDRLAELGAEDIGAH